MQQGKGLPCSPCSLSTNQKPAVRSTASFCAVSVAQMGCRKRSCQSQGSSAATQAGLPMAQVDCTKRREEEGGAKGVGWAPCPPVCLLKVLLGHTVFAVEWSA